MAVAYGQTPVSRIPRASAGGVVKFLLLESSHGYPEDRTPNLQTAAPSHLATLPDPQHPIRQKCRCELAQQSLRWAP